MKIVIIYGAPAVGKLTVARKLIETTGFKLLHNHLFFNIAIQIFPRFSADLESLYEDLHLVALRHAFPSRPEGIILTVCTPDAKPLPLVEKIRTEFTPQDCKLYFVKLVCDKDELLLRVVSSERRDLDKLCDPTQLEDILKGRNYQEQDLGLDTITVDTSVKSVEESADAIGKFIR